MLCLSGGVGGEVLTENKSQNRIPDLLKAWARAIKAVSSVGVPDYQNVPPKQQTGTR